jgi:GT2 family glycosyltransferase
MLAIIEENDEIGMVGPIIIDEEGTITPPCKRNVPSLIDLFLKLFLIEKISLYIINKNQILKRIYNRRYFKSEYVQCISGACMLIKRKALDKVGYFDEAIPMYFEDNDLCFRFTKAGYKIYYCADAELIHICGASTKKTGKTKSFDLMVYKASDAFLKKHKTSMYFLIHRLILFSSALLFLGIDIILFPFLFQFKRNYLKSIIEKHFYTLLYALSIKESISIENNFKETEHLNSELNRK